MFLAAEQSGLAQLQRAFADAIYFDDAPIPATVRVGSGPAYASRFSVYRNNVIAGLINAIAARYPIVRKLLWDDTFNRIAQLYVMAEPPRSPILLQYGETFPQFLRTIGQGSSADYLADLAELEAARTRAYHAADATPLSLEAFKMLTPEELPDLRLTLHPSTQLLKSRFPVVSVWEANQHAGDNSLDLWQTECALIVRPHLKVEVRRLTPGAFELFKALFERLTIGEAIACATASTRDFDLAECFSALVSADIAIAFERPVRRP